MYNDHAGCNSLDPLFRQSILKKRRKTMLLNKITADHPDFPKVTRLYETAFPDNERPLSIDEIAALTKTMSIDILGIYPDDTPEDFAGFFVIIDAGDFVYLNFFATSPEKRGTGIGGKAAKALIAHCGDKPLLFDYESPFEPCDNLEQRKRRRAFYLKNGFYETGWFFTMSGTELIIAASIKNFDKALIDAFVDFSVAHFPDMTEKPKLYRRDDL